MSGRKKLPAAESTEEVKIACSADMFHTFEFAFHFVRCDTDIVTKLVYYYYYYIIVGFTMFENTFPAQSSCQKRFFGVKLFIRTCRISKVPVPFF